jgi:RNA polymerase primary sigma factor
MAVTQRKKSSYEEGSLDQYLRDISAYPLINREEEVRLAQRIRMDDQAALDKLVASNLRFVVSVAKKYQNQGVSLSDLINEGNLGLIRAAHKFDETKGIKFISYAVWWIRQAILQALAEQSRIVRVPLNRAGTLHRIGKRANALLQELGREATHAEIAEGMELSEEEVAKTMSISQTHLSLDAPLTPGEDNKLLDYLADNVNPTPDEQTFEKALTESIEEALSGLKEREAKILRLYFGLDGEEPMTLEQIGSLLGITRERVRQIKEKALSRLRHVSRARDERERRGMASGADEPRGGLDLPGAVAELPTSARRHLQLWGESHAGEDDPQLSELTPSTAERAIADLRSRLAALAGRQA